MRANHMLFGLVGGVVLTSLAVLPAEAKSRVHDGPSLHSKPAQSVKSRKANPAVRAVPPRGTGLAVAPLPTPYDPYGPVPLGAPVNGAPFGYSGCYGSRVQVYVPGQGLVWRPQVDCPYQDNP